MFKKKEQPQALTLKERHYKYVLDEDCKDYFKFRENLRVQEMNVKGHTIKYIDQGEGPVLFLMPGSTGKALTFYNYITELSSEYRVIAIDYPVTTSLDEITDLMLEFMMTFKQIDEKLFVVSNSFGTVLLQEILRKSPTLFDQIFFIHGTSRDEQISKKVVKLHKKTIKSFLKSVQFLNYDSFRKRFSKRIRKSIMVFSDDISKRLFWEGLYEEILYSTDKDELLSNYVYMQDFWMNVVYTKDTFNSVTAPVMIIESHSDLDNEMPEKLALCAVFPTHELIVLDGDTNQSLIKNKDEIIKWIRLKCK